MNEEQRIIQFHAMPREHIMVVARAVGILNVAAREMKSPEVDKIRDDLNSVLAAHLMVPVSAL